MYRLNSVCSFRSVKSIRNFSSIFTIEMSFFCNWCEKKSLYSTIKQMAGDHFGSFFNYSQWLLPSPAFHKKGLCPIVCALVVQK